MDPMEAQVRRRVERFCRVHAIAVVSLSKFALRHTTRLTLLSPLYWASLAVERIDDDDRAACCDELLYQLYAQILQSGTCTVILPARMMEERTQGTHEWFARVWVYALPASHPDWVATWDTAWTAEFNRRAAPHRARGVELVWRDCMGQDAEDMWLSLRVGLHGARPCIASRHPAPT